MIDIKGVIARLVEGRNLSASEAEGVMGAIMEGQTTDSQIGAFLAALRMKGESVEEITAFARVMRDKALKINLNPPGTLVDTCGTGGDRVRTFNVSTLAALAIAGAGGVVAKHGNRSNLSRCGSADLLEAFGVKIGAEASVVAQCIERVGLGFMFAPIFHPAMKRVVGPRKEIGIRTVFNILGPLTNPASAPTQVAGVFDPALTETFAQVLNRLGVRRAYIVHGEIGVDEVAILGKSRISELKNGAIETYQIEPSAFGLRPAKSLDEIAGGELDQNLRLAVEVLHGAEGARTDMAALNAALGLAASGRAPSIERGLDLAYEALKSGRALEKLRALVKESGGDEDRFEALTHEYS